MIVRYFAGKNWRLAGLNKWKDIEIEKTPDPDSRVAVFNLDGFDCYIYQYDGGFIAAEPPQDPPLPKWLLNAAGGGINRVMCCEERDAVEKATTIARLFQTSAVLYRYKEDGTVEIFKSIPKS